MSRKKEKGLFFQYRFAIREIKKGRFEMTNPPFPILILRFPQPSRKKCLAPELYTLTGATISPAPDRTIFSTIVICNNHARFLSIVLVPLFAVISYGLMFSTIIGKVIGIDSKL